MAVQAWIKTGPDRVAGGAQNPAALRAAGRARPGSPADAGPAGGGGAARQISPAAPPPTLTPKLAPLAGQYHVLPAVRNCPTVWLFRRMARMLAEWRDMGTAGYIRLRP